MRVLAAGGTIAMSGDANGGVTPELDGPALLAAMPGLENRHGIDAETVINVPSAHLTLEDQLHICREARDAARRGIGVVVTHGTDTLEETAMLCRRRARRRGADRVHRRHQAPPPRPAPTAPPTSATPSAWRPAGRGGHGRAGLFGGEIHHARCVRKTDTTSLVAFSSPQTGPLGRVTEGHPTIWSRIPRNQPLDPPNLDKRVLVVPDDGRGRRLAGPAPRWPPSPTE